MDESFEDPGTFDEDDYEDEQEVDSEALLEVRPAPDLNGLLSVSPLVRFMYGIEPLSISCLLRRRAYKTRGRAPRRFKGSALPVDICEILAHYEMQYEHHKFRPAALESLKISLPINIFTIKALQCSPPGRGLNHFQKLQRAKFYKTALIAALYAIWAGSLPSKSFNLEAPAARRIRMHSICASSLTGVMQLFFATGASMAREAAAA